MRGYKGMNEDMTCRGMKFEVGKTYHVNGIIQMCKNGLHFCQNLKNVFDYYDRDNSRVFEVETDKQVFTDGEKSVTSELRILRELTKVEINRNFYGNGYGYGYEGEVNGILICGDKDHIPEQLQDIPISYNSGYGYAGLNDNIEIEPV